MSQEQQVWIIKADGTPTFVYYSDMQEGDRLATEKEIQTILQPSPTIRSQEIISELYNLDLKSIRPLRALAFQDVNEDDRKKLIEYRVQAKALRDELASLEALSEGNNET